MTEAEAIRELKVKYLGDSDAIVEAKEMAINALEKGISVSREIRHWDYFCPKCGSNVEYKGYCHACGQRVY